MRIGILGWFVAGMLANGCARAEAPAVARPHAGVTFRQEVRTEPAQRLCWATVDLDEPRVSLHVAQGGPDPDGDGKWQTTLMPPTAIAKREGFELAVNGDFFSVKRAEADKSGVYQAEQWAAVLGPAVTDGKAWATAAKPRPCLVVKKSGKVAIESLAKAGPDDAQVIAGNVMLVDDGKAVAPENATRHPRTVVGLDEKGTRLTILVVDGRREGEATGMTYAELSREMIAAGCRKAVNLDGGGSSVMVVREGEAFVVKNHPSNEKERPVANVLGVDVRGEK
jgi:exopolysaccharide biosynthesis protein